MSIPTLPDLVRQVSLLSDIRGETDQHDLRTTIAIIDRLTPATLVAFEQHARLGQAAATYGVSPAASAWLQKMASGRADAILRAYRDRIPILLRRLLDIGAATTDQTLVLVRECGVATIVDLEAARQDGRLSRLPAAAAQRIGEALTALAVELRPLPLGRAADLAAIVIDLIDQQGPLVLDRSVTGDARRFEPLVRAASVAACSADPVRLLDTLSASPAVEDVLHRTARRAIVRVHQTEVDVRAAGPDEYGSMLFSATGSAPHVLAVAARRRRPALCAREEDVYTNAGLPWIPPELRHATGEIEAAEAGRVPPLVQQGDVRGDLHMHSTYSDGQDTIEAMVLAAIDLGYEYIAITDHSESAAAARTVSRDQLARQRDEIDGIRARHPQITILHGIEVDILPDGRLDFADAVLEQLDIVLASLHDAAHQDGPALTRRCIQAIRHPLVNVIAHPANQLVGRRSGYPMNYPAVYAAAAEFGTALEIDGGPGHLDLDGEHAREAVTAGVTLTVDSDCHRALALGRQMTLGLGTARRGWVEARHVLNCRSIDDVRAFVHVKRTRGAS